MKLLVIIPVRGRRVNAERVLKSFTETADHADLIFVSDPDDQETYENMDWGNAQHIVTEERLPVIPKLNYAWAAMEGYDAYMCTGDDNVFITPHWDTILLKTLEELGGTGWVYPDDRRRNDIPENWLASADVTAELGWFAPPQVNMYFPDNIIAELGRRAGLISFCPEAVVEHHHYSVDDTVVRDDVYLNAEKTWGDVDREAFLEWQQNVMPLQVAQLRRRFNKDIEWLFSRI